MDTHSIAARFAQIAHLRPKGKVSKKGVCDFISLAARSRAARKAIRREKGVREGEARARRPAQPSSEGEGDGGEGGGASSETRVMVAVRV